MALSEERARVLLENHSHAKGRDDPGQRGQNAEGKAIWGMGKARRGRTKTGPATRSSLSRLVLFEWGEGKSKEGQCPVDAAGFRNLTQQGRKREIFRRRSSINSELSIPQPGLS